MSKFIIFLSILFLYSCSLKHNVEEEKIRCLNLDVSNWKPKQPDGESLDLITELRSDLESKSYIGLIYLPKNYSEGSVKVECIFENDKIVALRDVSRKRFHLDDSISVALTKWVDSKQSTINVTLIAKKVSMPNQSQYLTIIAMAVEGGPFFK
jgi:hypothetical protein